MQGGPEGQSVPVNKPVAECLGVHYAGVAGRDFSTEFILSEVEELEMTVGCWNEGGVRRTARRTAHIPGVETCVSDLSDLSDRWQGSWVHKMLNVLQLQRERL